MWRSAARCAAAAVVDAQGLGMMEGRGLMGAAAATSAGVGGTHLQHRHHQFQHARHYAKGGKQMKRKGVTVTPQAPTNASMKSAVDRNMQALMAAITPEQIPKEDLSEEDLKEFEARAKEYSRMKMAQHREWQNDLNEKIRHKRNAIAALPKGYLRDAAMVEDIAMFPLKRTSPGMTPKIEGFYEAGG